MRGDIIKMISIKEVNKRYKIGQNEVKALNKVSINIKSGTYVSVVGPSGSGKSTLLHVMGGLDSVDEGEVWIAGQPLHQLNESQLAKLRRENIGFVFQQFQLLPTATAIENVMMPLLTFFSSQSIRHKAGEALEKVGLGNRKDHLPSRLSGGEQQRVAIARALVTNPSIILADEPTGNLDSENGNKVIQILEQLHSENHVTVIIITHDLQIAERAQEKIYMLDGEITHRGD